MIYLLGGAQFFAVRPKINFGLWPVHFSPKNWNVSSRFSFLPPAPLQLSVLTSRTHPEISCWLNFYLLGKMGYFLLKNTRISHTHNKGPHCEKISDLLTVQGTVLVEKSFILKVHFITSSDNARVGPVWVVPRGTNIYTVVKVLHTHTWVENPSLSETSGFGCPKKERKSCCSPTCAFFSYLHA